MERLIDANELYVDARFGENEEPYISLYQINNAPTVDAEPVRHGRWIDRGYLKVGYHCSLCGGYVVAGKEKYCPHCGAKMTLD